MLSFIEKTVSNIKEKDYKKFDGQYGIFTSKEESIPPTSEAKGKVTAFTVGLGLMIIGLFQHLSLQL